jgi:hypothetical protein
MTQTSEQDKAIQDKAISAVQRAAELALVLGVTEDELIILVRNEAASARSTAQRDPS